ncbi:UDP-N-acetylglucosamine 1-carboxyvinyltransferase [Candidatus Palauibacter sp.]|uniref:UDP-N-acetylglucosamine 1-carboxyvinyltransferase n=1 Tax=Candidatus Palauibacter sp. TaxID=3101350 RepID=UPI003AF1FC91
MHFRIEGGHALSGVFTPAGNKNAALPVLAGVLLAREPVRLENVPRIQDVETLLRLLEDLGVRGGWAGPGVLELSAADVDPGATLDPEVVGRIRASVLLAGPMLARIGTFQLVQPGGDFIGRRRLDTHMLALQALGATVNVGDGYLLRTRGLRGASIFLDEPSVTGTENAVLAAVTAEGTTELRNAATEPHVQDLCRFLATLGARIEGIGTPRLCIEGVDALGGGTFRLGPDHIEVGSMIGLSAATGSNLRIAEVDRTHFDPLRVGFQRLGVEFGWRDDHLLVHGAGEIEIRPDLGGQIPKLDDGPWPAFPADLTSIALVTATQCRGTVLIHEKMFESRMFFVDKVIAMGARIVLCDPHRAVVVGPSPLRGARLESPDIRAGMALLIAALAAEGTSEVHNIGQIERGYERIHERLGALGARIERVAPDGP